MWPISFRPNLNTSVCPLLLKNVVPYEGFKIMIRSLVLGRNCEENRVTHRFEAQDGIL